jgi:hypothetical protein
MSSGHTDALAELKRQLAEENFSVRALEAEAEAAEGVLAAARDAVVQAYVDQDTRAAKNATSARDKADARMSELAMKQEAARLRVRRAEQAAQAYEAENAADLIAELEPAAIDAVEAVRHHAAELVAADRRWHTVSTEVSRLLRHIPGATPATDARGEHKLSPIITAIRKAGDQIESPMPTWRGLRDHEQEQERRRLLRLQRARKHNPPSADVEAA